MDIRVAGIENDSIVDGPGFRITVFVQGCPHDCPGCHNPETHDFASGKVMNTEKVIEAIKENELLDGLTLSGGEPFCQCEACAELAKAAHETGLNVWSYSGWTYEQLLKRPDAKILLDNIDVLVDGPFVLAERTLELRFRGSRNQRLIDVKRSLAEGTTVLYSL